LNGGTTWIDQGSNQSPNNAACGATITATWDFADFSTTQPLKFRIYGFNASGTSGVLQLLNVNFNGKVCPVTDADGDGYDASVDCNDNNAAVHPGATELCNGIDDNCDTQIDEGVKSTFYADADNDTYGNPNVTTLACSAPTGYVSNNTDCNDGNINVHPNATEVCNGIDDNCNSQIDEGVKSTFYADADNDTYGNPNITTLACSAPTGYVSSNTDCNDGNINVHPNATEVCNGIDDNCNSQIDEGVKSTFYADADNDTYGNPNVTTLACSAPRGYVSSNTDCDDNNAAVHPGVTEICNAVDDNCNGTIDEPVVIYNYTNNTSGAPSSVSVNASATSLTRVNGAIFPSAGCSTGFSAKNLSIDSVYKESLSAIEFTISPNIGNQVEATSFSAGLRRSSTGPALARRTIGGRRAILLLALRGRLGRVVRGLR
jgi:hypothetical protein